MTKSQKIFYETGAERNLMEIEIMKQKPAADRRKMRYTRAFLLFAVITAFATVRSCQLSERAVQQAIQNTGQIEYPLKFPESQFYQNSSALPARRRGGGIKNVKWTMINGILGI